MQDIEDRLAALGGAPWDDATAVARLSFAARVVATIADDYALDADGERRAAAEAARQHLEPDHRRWDAAARAALEDAFARAEEDEDVASGFGFSRDREDVLARVAAVRTLADFDALGPGGRRLVVLGAAVGAVKAGRDPIDAGRYALLVADESERAALLRDLARLIRPVADGFGGDRS